MTVILMLFLLMAGLLLIASARANKPVVEYIRGVMA